MAIEFSQQRRTASDIGAWLDLEPVDNDLSQVAWSSHRSVPQGAKAHFSLFPPEIRPRHPTSRIPPPQN